MFPTTLLLLLLTPAATAAEPAGANPCSDAGDGVSELLNDADAGEFEPVC